MALRKLPFSRSENHGSGYAATKSQPNLVSDRAIDDNAFGSLATRSKSLPLSSISTTYAAIRAIPWAKTIRSWKKLPARILNLVLEQLRRIHLGPNSTSCTTCYMRDLASVQMTCKAWFSDAQRHLYTNIEIVGDDDTSILQKWRLTRAARLIRLRSTLRSKHLLASLVKTIHVPDPHIPLYLPNDYPNPEYDAYLCTLASVIMTCPNLEALTGFIPFYNHTFDRLTHALSTRTKLRQHVWIIAENDDVSARSQEQLPPGLLDVHQVYQFTHYHDRWTNLETLMLCSPASLGVIEHDLFIHILNSLPSLQNLCISTFDADDFHDKTLLSLPRIQRLRLEECNGITEHGLMRWAASPVAFQVKELSLLHQNIVHLSTLSKVLASLSHLTRFTIWQIDIAPSFTHGEERVTLQPTLASPSLVFLHWDFHCREDQGPGQNLRSGTRTSNTLHSARLLSANAHLALSIQHDGFPRLALLRAPRDTAPYGALQSVCLPNPENNFFVSDDRRGLESFHTKPFSNSLQIARIRAHRMARQTIRKQVAAQIPRTARSSPNPIKVPWGTVELVNWHVKTATRAAPMTPGNNKSTTSSEDGEGSIPRCRSNNRDTLPQPARSDEAQSAGNAPQKQANFIRLRNQADVPSDTQVRDDSPSLPPRHPLHFRSTPSEPQQPMYLQHNTISTARFKRPAFYLLSDAYGNDENGGLVGWAELLGIQEKAKMESDSRQSSSDEVRMSSEYTHSESSSEYETSINRLFGRRFRCDGSWNRSIRSDYDLQSQPRTVRPLNSSSKSSAGLKSSKGSKSKSKSSSRFSLPLDFWSSTRARDGERWRHVARPRGERGETVSVQDFFGV